MSQVASPGARASWAGPLGGAGWALAWADYAIYKVEYALVVASLLIMTVIEFVYIVSIYVIEQKILFINLKDPTAEVSPPWGLGVLLLFVLMVLAAVVNNTRLGVQASGEKRPLVVRALASLGLLAGVCLAAWGTQALPSSADFYTLLALAVLGPVAWGFWRRGERVSAGAMGGVTVLAAGLARLAPEGYSWADNVALLLLLWVGFLGASMAAKQGRHLRVDAAKKLWPAAQRARLGGVSLILAAGFAGLLTWVGGIYLFHEDYGRFWTPTVPGEIPDWLVTLAIPLSFLLITLRMGARGVVQVIWGGRYGEEGGEESSGLEGLRPVDLEGEEP